jgi:hypothetical protein
MVAAAFAVPEPITAARPVTKVKISRALTNLLAPNMVIPLQGRDFPLYYYTPPEHATGWLDGTVRGRT